MPRISETIVSGYYNAILNLSDILSKTNDKKDKTHLKLLFEKHLKIGYDKEYENEIQNELNH